MDDLSQAKLRELVMQQEATVESMLVVKTRWSRERLIYRILLLLLAVTVIFSATR